MRAPPKPMSVCIGTRGTAVLVMLRILSMPSTHNHMVSTLMQYVVKQVSNTGTLKPNLISLRDANSTGIMQ